MKLLAFIFCLLCVFARAEIAIHEKAQKMPFDHQGPFTRLGDGSILGVDEHGSIVSKDEGTTWEHRNVFDESKFQPSGERALLRTKEGTLVFAFLNRRELAFKWDDKQGGPQEDCRLPVYISRSSDDGKTWAAPVLLQDGWCGAVRNMIQLRTGRVLLICQKAVRDPGRHVTINYFSDDQGQTWQPSNVIDLGSYGGYGDHGGGLEGTVIEKRDGMLKLLLRTPQGCFQEYASRDGAQWTGGFPSTIAASDAPGTMLRLTSGRTVLLWNRYMDPAHKLGRRQELSIAFTNNDGLTWTTPQVIATNYAPPGGKEAAYRLSYPYVFEQSPGRLWITTMQGDLRMALNEADWLQPVDHPMDGKAARIITLGDSITKGVRPGVKPTETFSALLQDTLRQNALHAQVHDVGIGGERTDQALKRLTADVIQQRPDLVTIMYGTNDSWIDMGKSECRITAEAYESNLREIVKRLKEAHIRPVLMTEPKFGEQNPKNGAGEEANVRLTRYMELCRKVAREMDVPLVDQFAHWAGLQRRGQKLQSWTTDGCHPNPAGHADMAHRIAQTLLPILQRMDVADEKAPFKVQLDVVSHGYDGQMCWVHPRAGAIPSQPPSVVLTMQKLLLTGSDVFYALNDTQTDDLGKTWSPLREHTDTLGRRDEGNGVIVAACDFTPKWHAKSGKLLGTGHTVRYLNNKVIADRKRETSWAVYDEKTRQWSNWATLAMPDDPKFYSAGAGCVQRVDLPNGDILLPIYFNAQGEKYARATVLRCTFDGTTLKFAEQGNELTLPSGRGLDEPSLTRFGGRFYLTLRNDNDGLVSVSDDGLHFGELKSWTWEDGSSLGNYNTQQHWVTHSGALYLVYTRKGAHNDHMIRHRAPLFIAQIDPLKLCVLRNTERILVPDRGARLGNFGVVDVSEAETWVTVAEWMQTFGPNYVLPPNNPYGSDNSVFAARIQWAKPNADWNRH